MASCPRPLKEKRLLAHRKVESTVRYLGIEVDDALAIAGGGADDDSSAPSNRTVLAGHDVADLCHKRP
jgi:hypothetical protein